MTMRKPQETVLPMLQTLGTDLLQTTPRQRVISFTRPFAGLLLYMVAAHSGWWWITPFIVFLIFVFVVTATHDAVHGCLGLNRRQTDWALFVMGAFLLESGHAYRLTHLQHHRVFPGPDDPEGDPARMTFWQSIWHGPLFLPRLWLWAYRRSASQPSQSRWLLAEASLPCLLIPGSLLLWQVAPSMLIYVLQVVVGGWVYPLLNVHLPHHHYGDTPLTQTRTIRGRIVPALFLELTYHLEHHLYPQVPSHHLAELSRRIDPLLRAEGVQPIQVP